MYADTYFCSELKTQCEQFLADNLVRTRQKVMMSAAYGDLFFSLPIEAMLAIQALLPANEGCISPEETDENRGGNREENRVERSRSEGEALQTDYVLPSLPAVQAEIAPADSMEKKAEKREIGENLRLFPALGTVVTPVKPRAYSDAQSIDLRALQRNSPFPVKVLSEKKKRKKAVKAAKTPVWGPVSQSPAAPLTHIQSEQREGGQFFNPWGLESAPSAAHDFRDIQEAEQAEEELEVALQVIADMQQAEKLAR